MNHLILIILGIIQGLTEFLPISSSGHLVLLQNIFKFDQTSRISYTVFFHLGTTFALLFFFRKKIIKIIIGLFNKSDITLRKSNRKILLLIMIGSLPVAIAGFCFQQQIEQFFYNSIYPTSFLLINGLILFLTKYVRSKNKIINYSHSLVIGIAQAVALLPGISRAGITIAVALMLGLRKEDSFDFSFLLSLPAVIGGNILMIKDIAYNLSLLNIIIAIITPLIIGVLALNFLKQFVIQGKLYYFAFYCWFIGFLAYFFIK